ncbi:MAG: ABC transporter ATP-binding protein [Spirochaetia bacterium]|nr:ABC transporter ATP-binding protein [Spirochaetia bacterium]
MISSQEPSSAFLELKAISKTYHISKSCAVHAVTSVSCKISEGEFVALIGPSGCGKSTLLRVIAGFLKPTEGDVLLEGKPITSLGPQDRSIPMVFQNYALFPHFNVFENIAYGLRARNLSEDIIGHDVAMMCQMLNLVGVENRFPNELSDGQQQRVALARALVLKPKILLFDEPLSNLDARLRIQTRAQIKRIQATLNITVLYVTHDQQEALSLPDRVIVMNKGRIVQEGKPRDVYNHPKTPFVADFIGNSNFYYVCVTQVSLETVQIAMQDLEFEVPLKNCEHHPIKDELLLLSINPITVGIASYADKIGKNQYLGIVEQSLFNGQAIEYTVSFGDVSLRLLQPNVMGDATQFINKSKVILTFNPESFHLFRMQE